ncbi:MAG: V-type ATP synthase subunit D [Patescibacteria group bacterium]
MATVSPNRQELLKQSARKKIVSRGHKLLKSKRDSLIKMFLELIQDVIERRKRLDQKMLEIDHLAAAAFLNMSPDYEKLLVETVPQTGVVSHTHEKVMGVKLPRITYTKKDTTIEYSLVETSSYFDEALKQFFVLIPDIMDLLQRETELKKIAEEIVTTRRRVNSLEKKVIPQVEDNIKYIKLRLQELQLESTSQLLMVKKGQQ